MYIYIYIHILQVLFILSENQDRDRHDAVALEDLPRLLPDMKFDKFEVEVGDEIFWALNG